MKISRILEKGFDELKEKGGSIGAIWTTVAKSASDTTKSVDESTKATERFNSALKDTANIQGKVFKSQQKINKSSSVHVSNWAKTESYAAKTFAHLGNMAKTLKSMATGGGAGSAERLAGQMGMMFGAQGALIGGVIATAVGALGTSVTAALNYRSQAAAAAGYGVQNPFATQAYGNYLAMYTGGEAGTAALFGQIANQQTTLGGPEFQRNWAARFGVNMKGGQKPEDLAEAQLRAEFNMANKVRPELWKSTAQAMGVGDVVDMNRLWRLKGASGTEFQEELTKARKAAEELKLGETPDKKLKEAAELWTRVGQDFGKVVDQFGAWVSAIAGNQLAKDVDELLQHLSKGDWKWSDIFGRKATQAEVNKTIEEQRQQDIQKFGHTFEGWTAPFQWGWEELKRGMKGLGNFIIPGAKAEELPESPYAPSFDVNEPVKKLTDGLKSSALGWGVTENADDKARVGPYNLLAAAKIPDNIQDIRDILNRAFPIGGMDGGAGAGGGGMGGNQGWAGARRGSGSPFGRNTLAGGSTSAGGLSLAASKDMAPEDRALLDIIALRESGKASYLSNDPDYGAAFQGNRYQFLGKTWANEVNEMGGNVKDLSPEHQDAVALHLAKKLIGKRWEEALKNPSILKGILGPTWHGVWNEETGATFAKALEAEKK